MKPKDQTQILTLELDDTQEPRWMTIYPQSVPYRGETLLEPMEITSLTNSPTRLSGSTVIITTVGLFTLIGGTLADYNETHLFNPNWPPHAKFHNAQTMLLGGYLGLLTLYFLWLSPATLSRLWKLNLAVLFASLYWLSQAPSILFPGTALVDSEFASQSRTGGQFYLDAIVLGLLILAYGWERHSIRNAKTQ